MFLVDREAESSRSSPEAKRHKSWASTLGGELPYDVTCRSALMSRLTQSRKRRRRSKVSLPESEEYASATPPRASWCFPGRTWSMPGMSLTCSSLCQQLWFRCIVLRHKSHKVCLLVLDCSKTVNLVFKVHNYSRSYAEDVTSVTR